MKKEFSQELKNHLEEYKKIMIESHLAVQKFQHQLMDLGRKLLDEKEEKRRLEIKKHNDEIEKRKKTEKR